MRDLWNELFVVKVIIGDNHWGLHGDSNIIYRPQESSDYNGSQEFLYHLRRLQSIVTAASVDSASPSPISLFHRWIVTRLNGHITGITIRYRRDWPGFVRRRYREIAAAIAVVVRYLKPIDMKKNTVNMVCDCGQKLQSDLQLDLFGECTTNATCCNFLHLYHRINLNRDKKELNRGESFKNQQQHQLDPSSKGKGEPSIHQQGVTNATTGGKGIEQDNNTRYYALDLLLDAIAVIEGQQDAAGVVEGDLPRDLVWGGKGRRTARRSAYLKLRSRLVRRAS
ncbi:hypothetical protein V6N13_137260 [Hibiscus sabdariffa]